MNLEQNIISTEGEPEFLDNSGIAEMQQAIEEIEKLKAVEKLKAQESEEEENAPEVSEETTEEETINVDEPEEIPQKKKEELWRAKKDKYRAIAAKEAVMQENERLKQLLNEALNSGTYHYSKSAYSDLELAKENKRQAIAEGDIEGSIEADIALTKALNAVGELEKWSRTETYKNEKEPQYLDEQQSQVSLAQEIANDWLETHPYLQPSSSSYNPKLANQVAVYVNKLDNDLVQEGREDLYFTEPYFAKIEKFITDVKQPAQKKNLEGMHVGGVRNSYASSSAVNGKGNSPTQMILTADEKRMCANGGISEKDWLRYKLDELKKGK
jgi:hypothetical protein